MMANNAPGPSQTSDQATENNQRLFKRYARVFQNPADPSAFAIHAQKLSAWLSDYKAYYVAARPEIIKLLLIAQGTLRRVLDVSADSVPFNIYNHPRNSFSASYETLVHSVLRFQQMFCEPDLALHIEALKNTVLNPQSSHTAIQSLRLADSEAATGLTATSVPVHLEHTPASQATAQITGPSVTHSQGPGIPIIDSPNNSSDRLPVFSITPEISPTSVISTSAKDLKSSAPTKRLKKRKTLDLTALAQSDIQGLMAQQESGVQSVNDSTKEDIVPSQNEIVGEAAPSTTTHQEDAAELPFAAEETTRTSVIQATESKDNQEMDVIMENIIISQSEPHIQAAPSESIHQENDFEPQPPQVPTDTEQMVVDAPPPALNTLETPITVQPSKPMSMDVDELNQTDAKTQQSTDGVHTVDTHEVENPEPTSLTEPESPVEADGPIFTSEMRVIAAQNGRSEASYIRIQFDIPEDDFHLVDSWIKREEASSVEKIRSTICISLGCYLTAEVSKFSVENDCETLEKSIARCQSTWPDSSGLVLTIESEGEKQALPLAPPLLVTPNNLVDISKYVSVGTNNFELLQYEDMNQYIFILHLHHPTRAQIKQLKEQRRNDKEWQDWIQLISRPLSPPIIPEE